MDRWERARTAVIAWDLWLGTMALCAAGLVVTLVVTRPLTLQVCWPRGRRSRWRSRWGTRPSAWSSPCGGRGIRSGGCSRPRGWCGR